MNKKQLRRKHLIQYLIALFVLLVVAVGSGYRFFRIDLTTEKRYTVSNTTKTLLKELNDVVYVRVYLDGDLPPNYMRFQLAIKEMLDEFRAYGGDKLQYEFINLFEEPDLEIRKKVIRGLRDKGLKVEPIEVPDGEAGMLEKYIFPGAVVSYRGSEFPLNLLKTNRSLPEEVVLNNSIQSVEYQFARAIFSLTLEKIPKIAFIEGHGELDSLQTASIMEELRNYFQVDRGYIRGNAEVLNDYEAIIIAQPLYPFDEADKFAIDQYVMKGGKVLWFLDPVLTEADSLSSGMTIGLANEVNTEDLLFKYGVRIDYNLLTDMQCYKVPVNIAPAGEEEKYVMRSLKYYPMFTAGMGHPVTRGLNYIKGQFASTLDTLNDPTDQITKTVLLSTSANSLSSRAPIRILVEEATREPDPTILNQQNLPVAILLEGKFESFYKNYSVPPGVSPRNIEIVKESKPTSMVVVGDGDIIRNEVTFQNGQYWPMPLGYEEYTGQMFGNLEFVMNLVNYMTDEVGLMELRSREFKMRLLDMEVIKNKQKVRGWIVLNTIIPVVIIILFGLAFYYIRKKKYTS